MRCPRVDRYFAHLVVWLPALLTYGLMQVSTNRADDFFFGAAVVFGLIASVALWKMTR